MEIAWTADDWGLSPGVNAGILELAKLGVVRRVSLMATEGYLDRDLGDLLETGVATGLHFNLTYGKPLGAGYRWLVNLRGNFHVPHRLFFLWSVPGIRGTLAQEISRELRLQLSRLSERGVALNYFDSHHHAHLLPGLIRQVSPILKQHHIETVRLPLDSRLKWTKQAPIYWLARWNEAAVQELGFQSMPFVYPGFDDLMSPERLRKRLPKERVTEAIVHPAKTNDFEELKILDSYRSGRLLEFEVLKSFAEPLAQ